MSLAVFLPLLLSLGIFLVPVWLLRNRQGDGRQDIFVSPRYMPPEAIRNASIGYSLRLAAVGPVFVLGATGHFWPAIIGAVSLGLGICLVYLLRGRVLPFLERTLESGQSFTVHAFIARQHDDDPRVRLFAAGLTLFVLVAVIACEAFALFGLFKLVFANDTVARALAFAVLLLGALYAFPAGHPGVIYSGQLQLGAIFLGLFGATAFLLYLHVSALTPLPLQGLFAIIFAAACCLAILIYRHSRYIETGALDATRVAKLLGKSGKALNPVISVFVVLIIVLAAMDLSATGFSAAPAEMPESGAGIPFAGLLAFALLPLFYPLADIVHWQRLAAVEKNREAYQGDTGRWLAALRRIFRIYAFESPLLRLFTASLGAITVAALKLDGGSEVMRALTQEAASGDNPTATAAFSLLLVALVAIALSTMASSFSAGLCTIRYDLPSVAAETLSGSIAGRAFFLAIVIALILAAEMLPMSFTSSTFLALVFCLCSPVLSFAPLILGPIATGRRVAASFALLILAAGAASTLAGLAAFSATGKDAWLWTAAPVCLGVSALLYAAGAYGSRMR